MLLEQRDGAAHLGLDRLPVVVRHGMDPAVEEQPVAVLAHNPHRVDARVASPGQPSIPLDLANPCPAQYSCLAGL